VVGAGAQPTPDRDRQQCDVAGDPGKNPHVTGTPITSLAPPRMVSSVPLAVLFKPPVTEAVLPLTVLPCPPLAEAAPPLTALLLPPLTES